MSTSKITGLVLSCIGLMGVSFSAGAKDNHFEIPSAEEILAPIPEPAVEFDEGADPYRVNLVVGLKAHRHRAWTRGRVFLEVIDHTGAISAGVELHGRWIDGDTITPFHCVSNHRGRCRASGPWLRDGQQILGATIDMAVSPAGSMHPVYSFARLSDDEAKQLEDAIQMDETGLGRVQVNHPIDPEDRQDRFMLSRRRLVAGTMYRNVGVYTEQKPMGVFITDTSMAVEAELMLMGLVYVPCPDYCMPVGRGLGLSSRIQFPGSDGLHLPIYIPTPIFNPGQ
ncbi:MAG: hypothetical protein ACE366_00045 [Bradymonadia bacterium]